MKWADKLEKLITLHRFGVSKTSRLGIHGILETIRILVLICSNEYKVIKNGYAEPKETHSIDNYEQLILWDQPM